MNDFFSKGKVTDTQGLKAFTHPLRMRIVEYLEDHREATSSTLAKHLGESTGQTSYHLRQLAKYGFIEELPDKGTARERWWRQAGFTVTAEDAQPLARQSALLGVVAEQAIQDRARKLTAFQRGIAMEEPQWVESALMSSSTAFMTHHELKALRDELIAVLEKHLDPLSGRDGNDPNHRRIRIHIDGFALPLAPALTDNSAKDV